MHAKSGLGQNCSGYGFWIVGNIVGHRQPFRWQHKPQLSALLCIPMFIRSNMIISSSSFFFLQLLLVGISHHAATAHASFLRGGGDAEEEPMNEVQDYQFSWDNVSQDNVLTTLHRGLQDTVVVIPVLPIIIIIVLICCLCNKQNQQQQGAVQQQRLAASPAVVEVANESTPKLVTATASKFSPTAPTGVVFVAGTDYAKISRITDDSIFRDTELRPGMKVVSINNISINSGAHAKDVIASCGTTVTMLAHTAGYFGNTENLVTATACKEQPDQTVGIVYKKEDGGSRMVLKSISESSLFANSELSPGMELVAINNVKVLSATHAKNLTKEAFPHVTILARRNKAVAVEVNPSDDVPVATATVLEVQL